VGHLAAPAAGTEDARLSGPNRAITVIEAASAFCQAIKNNGLSG
jgi:hypothetical protein